MKSVFTALMIIAATLITACVTPKAASDVRNELAADAVIESRILAREIEEQLKITPEDFEAYATKKIKEYNDQYQLFIDACDDDTTDTAVIAQRAARLTAAYPVGLERTKARLTLRAQKLALLPAKAIALGDSTATVARMANDEDAQRRKAISDLVDESKLAALDALIDRLAEQNTPPNIRIQKPQEAPTPFED